MSKYGMSIKTEREMKIMENNGSVKDLKEEICRIVEDDVKIYFLSLYQR